jgi:hypothetical protein
MSMEFAPHGSPPAGDEGEAFLPVRVTAVVQELIDEHARVSGDIVPIDGHTWAIHGLIAVDGDVIMAEFDHLDQARAALEQVTTGLAQQHQVRRSALEHTDSL